LKRTARSAIFLSFAAAALSVFSLSAQAQKVDLAFGVDTIDAPGASTADTNHQPVSLTGGAYPVISGDVHLFGRFAVGGEIAWRGSQGEWGGYQPFRPIFYDVDAFYIPKIANRTYLDLSGGIGAQSTRFYTPNYTCDFYTCNNYSTVNHFAVQVGAGLKFYAYGNFFIRPEGHFYYINNNAEFSSNRLARYGVSIGYTFGGR
jgi:hypothetical protein